MPDLEKSKDFQNRICGKTAQHNDEVESGFRKWENTWKTRETR